jgi:hypothetical protein
VVGSARFAPQRLQYFSSTAISFPQDGQYIKDLQNVANVALTTVRTERCSMGTISTTNRQEQHGHSQERGGTGWSFNQQVLISSWTTFKSATDRTDETDTEDRYLFRLWRESEE